MSPFDVRWTLHPKLTRFKVKFKKNNEILLRHFLSENFALCLSNSHLFEILTMKKSWNVPKLFNYGTVEAMTEVLASDLQQINKFTDNGFASFDLFASLEGI
jgi:hypothetical protein